MRKMVLTAVLLIPAGPAAFLACSSPSTTDGSGAAAATPGGSGGAAATGSGGAATTAGAGGAVAGVGGGGQGGSAGGPQATKVCWRACATAADCCPPGFPDCPGDSYPSNFRCEDADGDGVPTCVMPQCQTDGDCNPGGAGSLVCAPIEGEGNVCVTPCVTDGDCVGSFTCIGSAAGGTKFCAIEAEEFVCAKDSDCGDFGVCSADGRCVCTDDTQCKDSYAKDCVAPN